MFLYRPKDIADKYHKLRTNWKGPFEVTKSYNDHNYEIMDLRTKTKQVVHRSHLRVVPKGLRGSDTCEDEVKEEPRKQKIEAEPPESDSDEESEMYYAVINNKERTLEANDRSTLNKSLSLPNLKEVHPLLQDKSYLDPSIRPIKTSSPCHFKKPRYTETPMKRTKPAEGILTPISKVGKILLENSRLKGIRKLKPGSKLRRNSLKEFVKKASKKTLAM